MSVHSETNEIPQERWEKGYFIPRLPETLDQLDLLLLTESRPRKVHQDGIHFQNIKYIEPTLAAYVGESVVIRYDPRDIVEIKVFHEGKFLCRAISYELAGQSVSLKDVIRARNKVRNDLKKELSDKNNIVNELLKSSSDKNTEEGQKDVNNPKKRTLKRYFYE
jgi:putative transposase